MVLVILVGPDHSQLIYLKKKTTNFPKFDFPIFICHRRFVHMSILYADNFEKTNNSKLCWFDQLVAMQSKAINSTANSDYDFSFYLNSQVPAVETWPKKCIESIQHMAPQFEFSFERVLWNDFTSHDEDGRKFETVTDNNPKKKKNEYEIVQNKRVNKSNQ